MGKKTAREWFMEGYRHDTIHMARDKAIEAYKQSIRFDNTLTDAFVNLGFLHLNLARLEYTRHRGRLAGPRREEISKRLHFVLSLNPHNRKAQRLLDTIEGRIDPVRAKRLRPSSQRHSECTSLYRARWQPDPWLTRR